MKAVFVLAFAITVSHHFVVAPASIPDLVRNTIARYGKANIFVTLKDRPQHVLKCLKLASMNREQKLTIVANTLKEHARKTQKNICGFLSTKLGITVKSFWISNQILVKNIDAKTLEELIALPEVSEISADENFPTEQPRDFKIVHHREGKKTEWGVNIIGAEDVWALGINGTGVVVGSIDTGVRGTHSSFRENYLGTYGWLDPYDNTNVPTANDNGHGTHTLGTIVGNGGIGVAPGAKWMACKGCREYDCTYEALLDCGEFMACPTLPDKTNPDCTKAPRIVSNSWGFDKGGHFYDDVLKVWNVVGIIGVFGIGNLGHGGSSCSSVGYPADSAYTPVVAVGSTAEDESVSYFSTTGPSVHGAIKPDIAAPGSDIRSAHHTGDTAFSTMSGTSMATPHVSGVLALILQAHPEYSYQQATRMLYCGATHTVKPRETYGETCGGIPQDKYPNNYVGHGRVSASGSLKRLLGQNKATSSFL